MAIQKKDVKIVMFSKKRQQVNIYGECDRFGLFNK